MVNDFFFPIDDVGELEYFCSLFLLLTYILVSLLPHTDIKRVSFINAEVFDKLLKCNTFNSTFGLP